MLECGNFSDAQWNWITQAIGGDLKKRKEMESALRRMKIGAGQIHYHDDGDEFINFVYFENSGGYLFFACWVENDGTTYLFEDGVWYCDEEEAFWAYWSADPYDDGSAAWFGDEWYDCPSDSWNENYDWQESS